MPSARSSIRKPTSGAWTGVVSVSYRTTSPIGSPEPTWTVHRLRPASTRSPTTRTSSSTGWARSSPPPASRVMASSSRRRSAASSLSLPSVQAVRRSGSGSPLHAWPARDPSRGGRCPSCGGLCTSFGAGFGVSPATGWGVRRTTSRFGARLEPFMQVDLQLATGRSLEVVTQAETIASYGMSISGDYVRYTVGTAIVEAAERLSAEEREPALQHYLLLVGALRSVAEGSHDPGLVLDAFLLRGLSVAGFAPSFADCARCAAAGRHRFFSVSAGCKGCGSGRPAGTVGPPGGGGRLLG